MGLISPRLLLELSQIPEELWTQTAYAGLDTEVNGKPRDPLWDEESVGVFESLDMKAKRRAVKGGAQTPPTPSPEKPRERRESEARKKRRENRNLRPGFRYMRRMSLDPFLDVRLSSGAVRTLAWFVSHCGKQKVWKGCTNWVARQRTVTVRTIQNHYRELQAAGYIHHLGVDSRHQTTIALRAPVEPPPFKKKPTEEPQAQVIPLPEPAAMVKPRPPSKSAEPSKKTEATSPISHGQTEKKISPTQAIKARISERYVEPHPAIENRKLEPREPGSEPARPARPPSPALDGAGGAAEPLRISQDSQLTQGRRTAAGGQQAETDAFNARMDAILKSVVTHARVLEKDDPPQEGDPEAGRQPETGDPEE